MHKNKYLFSGSEEQNRWVRLLLTPSWLSGLAALVVGIAVVLGSAFLLSYNGSNLQLLFESQTQQPQAISSNYVDIGSKLSSSELISDIPLFIFWAGIGLVAYYFTIGLTGSFGKVVDLEKELEYVHADRRELLKQAGSRLAVRLTALVLWVFYLKLTMQVLLPYIIAVSYAGTGALNPYIDAMYLIWAIGLLAVVMHGHVVFLRLVFLKARLINQPSYD